MIVDISVCLALINVDYFFIRLDLFKFQRIHSSKRKLLDEEEEKNREAIVDDGDREEEQLAPSRFDTSLSSEQNSFTCFSATKTAPNPFKVFSDVFFSFAGARCRNA